MSEVIDVLQSLYDRYADNDDDDTTQELAALSTAILAIEERDRMRGVVDASVEWEKAEVAMAEAADGGDESVVLAHRRLYYARMVLLEAVAAIAAYEEGKGE
jgi:hypothetical protein